MKEQNKSSKDPKENKGRIAKNPCLVLEDSFSFDDLITIKTTEKKETENKIRIHMKIWFENKDFTDIRNGKKKIDLAIVIYVDKRNYNNQDVDNIAKIVLDSIKKSKKQPNAPYLIKDDSQIVRLLIYKLETKEDKERLTYSMAISFREPDPNKQMIIVKKDIV